MSFSIAGLALSFAPLNAASLPSSTLDNIDLYNTYQWNRQNRNTNKIDKGNWYEWWYYKVIHPETNQSFYFCYGIVNPWDKEGVSGNSRAFISFGDFHQKMILNTSYPVTEFESQYDLLSTRIGMHIATEKTFSASFEDKDHSVNFSFSIDKKKGWHALGWGFLFPSLFNIYWYPAQMDSLFSGTLTLDGRTYHFDKADGYQDHNWGRAFPQWWFWIAANSFDQNRESSFVGGGGDARISNGIKIPITAILLALHHEGKLYEFRSNEPKYLFEYEIDLGSWSLIATNPRYKLVVHAAADPKQMMDLPFQTPDGNIFHDYETLNGKLSVELYERRIFFPFNFRTIAILSTQNKAGLEFGLDRPYEPSAKISGSLE